MKDATNHVRNAELIEKVHLGEHSHRGLARLLVGEHQVVEVEAAQRELYQLNISAVAEHL